MTSNQLERQRNEEMKRANLEKEKLEDKGQRRRLAGDIIKGGISTLGTIFKNDKSWYNADPKMVEDAGRISFHTPLSSPIKGDGYQRFGRAGAATIRENHTQKILIPSVMSINFTPMYGNSEGELSALTTAARSLYSYIRYNNSGAKNYEANDLVFYLMSLDSLNILHAWGCHLYSVLTTAKSENWTYPKGMVRALGFHPDEFFDGTVTTNDVRAYLNQMAVRLRPFAFPAIMPIFARHAALCKGEFKDFDVTKSQVYIFRPMMVWKYNESVTPGRMDVLPLTKSTTVTYGMGWTEYRQIFESLYSTLIQSEDIGIMSGDIIKAFGDKLLQWDTIADDYHIEAIYSPEVLSQIQNMTVLGVDNPMAWNPTEYSHASCITIEEDTSTGALKYVTKYWGRGTSGNNGVKTLDGLYYPFTSSKAGVLAEQVSAAYIANNGSGYPLGHNNNNVLISMYKDKPDPDDVMVATRLSCIYEIHPMLKDLQSTEFPASVCEAFCHIQEMGSELVNFVLIYSGVEGELDYIDSNNVFSLLTLADCGCISGSANDMPNILRALFKAQRAWSRFDWAPRFRQQVFSITDHSLTVVADTYELANVAVLEPNTLRNLNLTAILSEFGIPKLSK